MSTFGLTLKNIIMAETIERMKQERDNRNLELRNSYEEFISDDTNSAEARALALKCISDIDQSLNR